jgi:uncharacterized DUF497 family protein
MPLRFSWNADKDAGNRRKHWVSFPEAVTAFGDPLSLTILDPDHSQGKVRFLLIGLSNRSRLLVVAHAECGGEIRIISARLATRRERRTYDEGE